MVDLFDKVNALAEVVATPAPVMTVESLDARRDIVIAIDPGHGGEDPGAIGARGSYEKHIVLSIAKRLKRKIDQEASMRPFLYQK